MKTALSAEMHHIDEEAVNLYGIPEILLMESAGKGVLQAAEKLFVPLQGKCLCVFAGSGNNGGDAFAAARYLAGTGALVRIFFVGNAAHITASTALNRTIAHNMGIEILPLETEHDWDKLALTLKFADGIIDGILGTGFKGELRADLVRLLDMLNALNVPVLAIDMPSGVSADTGSIGTAAIKADMTIAFGLPKVGHFFYPGNICTGELLLDDIGIPSALLSNNTIQQDLLTADLIEAMLRPRKRNAHKGSCGRVMVIAGSPGMTGAACLASQAALRVGCGLTTIFTAVGVQPILAMKLTEVMVKSVPETNTGILGLTALSGLLKEAADYDVVLLGPGLGRNEETLEMVRQFCRQTTVQLVLDADALRAFEGKAELFAACKHVPILTPHLGEMAGLLSVSVADLRQNILVMARKAAAEWQAILVLKSECTMVVYPQGEVYLSLQGNSGMATAGSGDVLSGTIAGVYKEAAEGVAPLVGVFLHGLAGDMAYTELGNGLLAGDILERLPKALLSIGKNKDAVTKDNSVKR